VAHIDAYRKDTGEKVRIPEHFLGHPVLGEPFQKTRPRPTATEGADDAPDTPAEDSASNPDDAPASPTTRAARAPKGK
jgi:hypothetical protein